MISRYLVQILGFLFRTSKADSKILEVSGQILSLDFSFLNF